MKIILRIISVIIFLAFILTVQMVLKFISMESMSNLLASGLFGIFTITGWAIILLIGPVAAIQLWRLKPSGRTSTMLLFASAAVYYFAGILMFGTQNPNLSILIWSILINLAGLLLLYSKFSKNVIESSR